MPSARLSRKPLRWFALAATIIVTVATVAIPSPASATPGTSYFPKIRISTGSGQGVDVKAGVYKFDSLGWQWLGTYATSYGSHNHRVDFKMVIDGLTPSSYYHPNVGTGTWEDCLNGTNSHCIGLHSLSSAYLQVTIRNLSNGACRYSRLFASGVIMEDWGPSYAC